MKKIKGLTKAVKAAGAALAMTAAEAMPVLATGFGDESVTVNTSSVNAGSLMGKIIGILLTITFYVGIALLIYGIYEIVMSFMQNQPEAKTKGIIMALSGAVMMGLKPILTSLGVIGSASSAADPA